MKFSFQLARYLFQALCLLSNLCIATTLQAQGYPGLPTRGQNPFLQSYFIPTTPVTSEEKLSVSHSLYITNTYQVENKGDENLIIDVENTRYDLQLTLRQSLWHFNLNIPFISNRSGFLDQTIEGWHDFWGLPQGGRDTAQNNRLNLLYQANGIDIINSQEPSEGIGDIQLAAGYQLTPHSQMWFAIELPSSDNSLFISNQELEYAFWYLRSNRVSEKLFTYGTLGLSFPANDGLFINLVENKVLFGQMGLIYSWISNYQLLFQLDLHSRIVKNSDLEALGNSFQAQFGLRITGLFDRQQLDLFFSEDIIPGYAPDITFGIRLSPMQF